MCELGEYGDVGLDEWISRFLVNKLLKGHAGLVGRFGALFRAEACTYHDWKGLQKVEYDIPHN